MNSRVSFLYEHQDLCKISAHYNYVCSALEAYFDTEDARYDQRFAGFSDEEVDSLFRTSLNEIDLTFRFVALAAIEAKFRIDYWTRCYAKKEDSVSKAFQDKQEEREKGKYPKLVLLKKDILTVWKNQSKDALISTNIDQLYEAFKYRNWFAHGRWESLEKAEEDRYDFQTIFSLGQTIMAVFPFMGQDPIFSYD